MVGIAVALLSAAFLDDLRYAHLCAWFGRSSEMALFCSKSGFKYYDRTTQNRQEPMFLAERDNVETHLSRCWNTSTAEFTSPKESAACPSSRRALSVASWKFWVLISAALTVFARGGLALDVEKPSSPTVKSS